MKKENTPISISKQHFWTTTIIGLLWVGVGIADMFSGLMADAVSIVLMLIPFVIIAILAKSNCENGDEMSTYNHMQAKARTRDLMHYVYGCAAILSALVFGLLQKSGADMHWGRVISALFLILMGIQDIITGIIFHRLEAE